MHGKSHKVFFSNSTLRIAPEWDHEWRRPWVMDGIDVFDRGVGGSEIGGRQFDTTVIYKLSFLEPAKSEADLFWGSRTTFLWTGTRDFPNVTRYLRDLRQPKFCQFIAFRSQCGKLDGSDILSIYVHTVDAWNPP